jgi:peptidoglycan hydrolase CwlO-like protein
MNLNQIFLHEAELQRQIDALDKMIRPKQVYLSSLQAERSDLEKKLKKLQTFREIINEFEILV